jgi:hypothetical protein
MELARLRTGAMSWRRSLSVFSILLSLPALAAAQAAAKKPTILVIFGEGGRGRGRFSRAKHPADRPGRREDQGVLLGFRPVPRSGRKLVEPGRNQLRERRPGARDHGAVEQPAIHRSRGDGPRDRRDPEEPELRDRPPSDEERRAGGASRIDPLRRLGESTDAT